MHTVHVPIRYSGATRCNLGRGSSAPGVHPNYHAPRLEAMCMTRWMDTSSRCAPPESGAHQQLAPAQHATRLASGTAVPGVRFVLLFDVVGGRLPSAALRPAADERHHPPRWRSSPTVGSRIANLKGTRPLKVCLRSIAGKKNAKLRPVKCFPRKHGAAGFSKLQKAAARWRSGKRNASADFVN